MLFTSSLRKAVDMYPPVSSEEAHRQLLEKRRKQMIRRHTCSTLIKQEVVQPKNSQCLGILEETNETEICQTSRSKHHTLEMPMAPPAPPPSSFLPPPQSNHSSRLDDWGESNFAPPPAAPILQGASGGNQTAYSSGQNNDDFDDEWTDEDEEQNEPSTKQSSVSNYNNQRREISRSHSEHGGDRAGSNKVNKSINRFSNFVKSGMEAYVIGESKMTTPASETHEIVNLNGIIQWKPIQKYYHCIVDKPKKESKLKGLKSFIAYSLTSNLTNIQVSRRYKHFDWLHEQLSAKYVLIPIPPLPEKQVAGRYEEDLIDHRKHILQLWVNKICRHPVLSQSEVWLHFISCTDEKDWKSGKRRAEKDEYVGGSFLNCITAPAQNLEQSSVDHQVERFQKSVKTSEEAMRTMQERMLIFQKAFAGPVKQNWQKMGGAFKTLQQSFEIDDTITSRKLTDALAHNASEYFEIGQLFDAHTKNDMEPVLENLYSYKGTVQNVPDILHVHKQAIQKFRESEGRLSAAEADKMRQRIDTLSYAVIAEIQHQTQEKVEEMNTTMGTYLKKQAAFYQDVAQRMSNLASKYE